MLPRGVRLASTIEDALFGADATVIMTEWPEYQALLTADMSALTDRSLLIDGRNMLDPTVAAAAGWEWVGIGRPLLSAPQTPSSNPFEAAGNVEIRVDELAVVR
jgi:UDPglucose 6-dehydrogenase